MSSTVEISEVEFHYIEKFVVAVYSPTCNVNTVNEARRVLFTQGNRTIENLPPTAAALNQHLKRSRYQAFVWRSLEVEQSLPDPEHWGWTKLPVAGYSPNWSELPEITKASPQLIRCGCKTSCRGRCKCKAVNMPCTELCVCVQVTVKRDYLNLNRSCIQIDICFIFKLSQGYL